MREIRPRACLTAINMRGIRAYATLPGMLSPNQRQPGYPAEPKKFPKNAAGRYLSPGLRRVRSWCGLEQAADAPG